MPTGPRRASLVALLAALTALAAPPARGSHVLYGADSFNKNLVTIDPATGAGTVVGGFGNLTLGSIAFDAASGKLYASDTNIGGAMYTLDPSTGAPSFVGSTGIALMHGLAIEPATGNLYGIESTGATLYRIDKTTAVATLVGSVGFPFLHGLEFDPTTGVLYASEAGPSSTGRFITIDTTTGHGTFVASTHRAHGIAFDAGGGLFACENGGFAGTPSTLYSIDPQTGAWSTVGDIVIGNVLALTFGPGSGHPESCAGDGSAGACPCGNLGAPGHGCDNSAATGGARLSGTGDASLASDGLVLSTTNELASALTIVLQGDVAIAPTPFGDGLRCAGGTLKRLRVESAVAGSIVYRDGAETSVSTQSALLGDTLAPGSTRIYQVYYRDPDLAFCPFPPGNTFNATNAVSVVWN